MHLQHARYDELQLAFGKTVSRKVPTPGKLRLVAMFRNPVARVCSEYDFAELSQVKTLGLSRWKQRYWGMKDYPAEFLRAYHENSTQDHIINGQLPAHNRQTRFIAGVDASRGVSQKDLNLAMRRLEELDCIYTLEGCGVDAMLRCMYRTIVGTAAFSTKIFKVSLLNDTSAKTFFPGQNYTKATKSAWAGKNKHSGPCAQQVKTQPSMVKALRSRNWADMQLYEKAKEIEAARGCN